MHFRFSNVRLASLAAACLLSLPAAAVVGGRTAATVLIGNEGADTGRLIVKYRNGDAPLASLRAQVATAVAANRQGVSLTPVKRMASGAQVFRISRHLSSTQARAMAADLAAGDPNVEYAEPDRLMQVMALPNDPMLSQQWSLTDATGGIRAADAWAQSTGSGVTVAVIDTGVRPHADLAKNLLAGYDFISDTFVSGDGDKRDANAYDPGDFVKAGYCGSGDPASNSSWHGTHVAGIVAAVAGNGKGVAGVAHGAKVLPLRALGKCGGYTSDIADAIVWAAGGSVSGVPANTHPARVISLSLGGGGACDRTTQAAIDSARARGAVVVVAAGNSATNVASSSPANCQGVIAVAATGRTGARASYSNYGAGITLAAPGGDHDGGILSTLNSGKSSPGSDSYASYMGTSMATPVVSAVAALVLSANSQLTPDQVGALLTATARPFPAACSQCGAGIVDAAAAVAQALSASSPPSSPPSTPPADPPAADPAPTLRNLAEVEPNNSVSKAQGVGTLPVLVTAKLSSNSDSDYFKVPVSAGKTMTATLTVGATSGFGINLYNTSGKLLAKVPGIKGVQRQIAVSNQGTATATVIIRVLRTTGATGAQGGYQLLLSE